MNARATSKKAHNDRMNALRLAASKVVATGKCPDCGAPLVRNNSMAGWWQCAGYAAPSHRQAGFKALAKCSFQTFTE